MLILIVSLACVPPVVFGMVKLTMRVFSQFERGEG